MGMGFEADKHGKIVPRVNVTPLVDVALVVLIIFMVVTPMITKSFWLNIPRPADRADSVPPSKQTPLVMTMKANGDLEVNRQPIARAALAERLPGMVAAAPGRVLNFDADDGVPYGDVVDVVDRCRAAGAVSIAVVTKHIE